MTGARDYHIKVYLGKTYYERLTLLEKITGKSKTELIREGIDYLFKKYIENVK